MSSVVAPGPSAKRVPALNVLLVFVMALFIGILIMVYFVTKKANPVFLDEHGKPRSSQTDSNGHAEHH